MGVVRKQSSLNRAEKGRGSVGGVGGGGWSVKKSGRAVKEEPNGAGFPAELLSKPRAVNYGWEGRLREGMGGGGGGSLELFAEG